MSTALAGLTLGLHLLTLHSAPGYESQNLGLYGRHAPSGITAGLYRNSEGRASFYLGETFETADRRFALTVGAVTGYRSRSLAPLVVPSMRLGDDDLAVRLSLIPKPPGANAWGLHLSVEREF